MIEEAVRWTARASACCFFVYLLTTGRGWIVRRRALIVFLVAHTIHFGTVLALAWNTDGANVEARGGWALNLAVAAAFYLGVAHAIRTQRKNAAATLREIVIAAIWLGFLQAYALRVSQHALHAIPTLLLLAAYMRHGLDLRRS